MKTKKSPVAHVTPPPAPVRKTGRLVVAAVVVAAGAGVIGYHEFTAAPATQLAAGEPLPKSTTSITVVDEATPVTTSDTPMQSDATIGEPMPPQPAAEAAAAPVLAQTVNPSPDLNLQFASAPQTQQEIMVNRLGVTLAMLQSTLPSTPSQARPLATTALSLARSADDAETATALEELLRVMPQNGPPTTGQLLTVALQAVQTPPPPPPPAPKAPKWLSGLVTITPAASPTEPSAEQATTSALNTLLMSGDVAAAIVLLNRPPFNTDPRFDDVRTLADTYMTTTSAFQNALSIYTRGHLTPAE